MSLLQALVKRGFVAAEQLRSVPGAEHMEDGALGDALAQAGLVSTDQLALALADLFGVAPALDIDFQKSDPSLRKRLRSHQAGNFKCIPLYTTSSRRVAVAMVDPTHPKIVDELAFVLGASIEPMVMSEAALVRQLELLYAMAPRRTTGFHPVAVAAPVDGPAVPAGRPQTRESPRLQMVPPAAAEAPVVAPAASVPKLPQRNRTTKQTQSYLAAVADLPLFVPSDPNAPNAPNAPVNSNLGADPNAPSQPAKDVTTPVPPMVSVTGPDVAVEQILASPDRQAAADNLFAFMRSCFGVGAMFVINGVFAMGRFGYNEGTECPAVESLVFSLSLPSAFRTAHSRGAIFHGEPAPDGEAIHGPLWAALRCPPPREVLVAPVIAAGQVSLLLYAHGRKHGRLDKFAVDRMEHVCSALANALVRLAG